MSSDDAVAPAADGWRVIYFLRKAPWVREEPVGAFRVGEHFATPMVRENLGTVLVDVDEKRTPYALAAPGEPATAFVEQAREHDREHRKWLAATRETRAQEKRIEKLRWDFRRECAEFEKSGRAIAGEHPARKVFDGFGLLRHLEKEAPIVGLAWFLAEHCAVGEGHEVALSAFRERLTAFLGAYDLPVPDAGTLSRAMSRTDLEPLKYKGKNDGWTGLSIRSDEPEEACLPAEGTDAFHFRNVASSVFLAHCVRRSDHGGHTTQTEMLLAFRAWCIRYRIRPWAPRELA